MEFVVAPATGVHAFHSLQEASDGLHKHNLVL